jgi:hypothetical protein
MSEGAERGICICLAVSFWYMYDQIVEKANNLCLGLIVIEYGLIVKEMVADQRRTRTLFDVVLRRCKIT